MENELKRIKKNIDNLGINSSSYSGALDSESRRAAELTISKLKKLAKTKIEQGFVKKRIPIKNGYREIFVLPEQL